MGDYDSDTIIEMLDKSLRTGSINELEDFLASHSNLPGPRGNIELVRVFAEAVASIPTSLIEKAWDVSTKMTRITEKDAPTGNPREFIVFCGVLGIATIGRKNNGYVQRSLQLLKEHAEDARWRIREAVAMGIQELVMVRGIEIAGSLEEWIEESKWLTLRAVAAGLAEPALLKDKEILSIALEYHNRIIDLIIKAEDRKSNNFKALRKSLGYTLSVLTVENPREGFAFMEKMLAQNDHDLEWVVKQNLRKKRLLRNHPQEINQLKKLLR